MFTTRSLRLAAGSLAAALLLLCLSINHLAAPAPPVINESRMSAAVTRDGIRITLPIRHKGEPLPATIHVELLNSDDLVMARGDGTLTLQQGDNPASIEIRWPQFSEAVNGQTRRDLLLWTRVRYRLASVGATGVEGVRSLGLLIPDLFALRLGLQYYHAWGVPVHARIIAEHPLTGAPVGGVAVEAVLHKAGDADLAPRSRSIKKSGRTDANGTLSLDFDTSTLHSETDENDLEYILKLSGSLGEMVAEYERTIEFHRRTTAIITTDKNIYQPGQPLHIRLIAYDPDSRRPRPSEPVTVSVQDEGYRTVFQRELKTDRFGVASTDWMIPQTAPLGEYSIKVSGEWGDTDIGSASVRVSRYELPAFVTHVEPDRNYYLPGQDATVRVTARFVYGEPVKAGRVRVVRESFRKWDFERQTWDVKEEVVWEGDTDAKGASTVVIPLAAGHKELGDEDWKRFNDLEYVARFTEAASALSEERRFRLRVTGEPIHVYAFSPDRKQSSRFPLRFYVVTNYADGNPARADVSIQATLDEDESATANAKITGGPAAVFRAQARTDEYGIALIESDGPLRREGELKLAISARDASGLSGNHQETMVLSDEDGLRLDTARALFHRGEPLAVEISSSARTIPRLQVDLFANGRLIRHRTVALSGGHANIEFAPGEDLLGIVTIIAYDLDEASESPWSQARRASTAVLFPRRRTLDIKSRFERDTVKPGETTRAMFTVEGPDGRPRETSLGVVLYDAAVEERERTESESGQGRSALADLYYWLFNRDTAISGVTLEHLEQLDDARPFPPSLDRVAGAIIKLASSDYGLSSNPAKITASDARNRFCSALDPLAHEIKLILDSQEASRYPRDRERLLALLAEHGVHLDRLPDPWGNPYRTAFSIRYDRYCIEIVSDGPDEVTSTPDDFKLIEHSIPFFDPAHQAQINSALESFRTRRGRFPRTPAELISELREREASFVNAKDPWGAPYVLRFTPSTYRPFCEIAVVSAGPDRKPDGKRYKDDVTVASMEFDWFAATREKIGRVIAAQFSAGRKIPADRNEFLAMLEANAVDPSELKDPWGQPLEIAFREWSRYADRAKVESVAATPQSVAVSKTTVEPVTQTLFTIRLSVSAPPAVTGFNHAVGFVVASFDQVLMEESRSDAARREGPRINSRTGRRNALASEAQGAVQGVVLDRSGAVIFGSTITLTNTSTGLQFLTKSDDAGYYAFVNLPPGIYTLRAESPGFMSLTVERVDVSAGMITTVDITLDVGTASELVTVTADGDPVLETSSIESHQVSEIRKPMTRPPGRDRAVAVSTPRLRQEFPETLLWQPSLVTGADGRAEIEIRTADSITTWRMAVIGSTEDGLIGTATTDLRAFLPFFIEHQPPPSLTIGDEVETLVVARNYGQQPAEVEVNLAPSGWMQVLAGQGQKVRVAADDSAVARVLFKATRAGEFKQEATASGVEAGDRVARPVSVRFDGRDTWRTYGDLFQRETDLDIEIPSNAIPGSAKVELKVYPELLAHAVEAVQGIVRRPYGCAEQTTSAGFASLIALRYLKKAGLDKPDLERKALGYLSEAIARIRSFSSDGGYAYFSDEGPDIAVTSYVLRFMAEAREFVPVDEHAIEAARRFLARQQREDGSWEPKRLHDESMSRVAAPRLTALVARALAASAKTPRSGEDGHLATSLERSLEYLSKATREYDDPYAMAAYIIAACQAGRAESVKELARLLASLERTEAGAAYWDIEANTPFYGWGRAGRIETTGLVVEALTAFTGASRGHDDIERTALRGLLFLLQNKDEYGVWYSTQATVNALGALIGIGQEGLRRYGLLKLAVSLDGGAPILLEVPVDSDGFESFDLGALLPQLGVGRDRHRITLRADDEKPLSAAVIVRAALPWASVPAMGTSEDGSLRLAVSFDRTEATPGEAITCSVKAERVGTSGYGMMIAEIGLPPGVDVDLASLRRAPISHFDVTADRVVLYLWPKAGGTSFSFTFRPRLKIKAAAQPSTLYDYYNPDSRVSVAPARFIVK